jgi:hypothetical protein
MRHSFDDFLALMRSLENRHGEEIMAVVLALTLELGHEHGEKFMGPVAFAYCLERLTFPVYLSMARFFFHLNLSRRHGSNSTFTGFRLLPIDAHVTEMCVICHDDLTDPVLTTCRHEFCEGCYMNALALGNCCPLCCQPPLSWDNAWLFISALLWSSICKYYATKQNDFRSQYCWVDACISANKS